MSLSVASGIVGQLHQADFVEARKELSALAYFECVRVQIDV
jgi:hypothetical protein